MIGSQSTVATRKPQTLVQIDTWFNHVKHFNQQLFNTHIITQSSNQNHTLSWSIFHPSTQQTLSWYSQLQIHIFFCKIFLIFSITSICNCEKKLTKVRINLQSTVSYHNSLCPSFKTECMIWFSLISRQSPHTCSYCDSPPCFSFEIEWLACFQLVHWQKPTTFLVVYESHKCSCEWISPFKATMNTLLFLFWTNVRVHIPIINDDVIDMLYFQKSINLLKPKCKKMKENEKQRLGL